MMRRLTTWILMISVALVMALGGCSSVQTKSQRKFSREQAASTLNKMSQEGLLIGEFPLRKNKPILDGDTIVVDGLDASLRLIGIDTEETFKKDWERRMYSSLSFDEYRRKLRGDAKHPVKMATPMGEEAWKFALKFFKGVRTVRLERDHPKELRGFYGRHLAYVFVERDGQWINYNIEAVRAGMSPYYTKYARSRRFEREFQEAEAEARAQQIGIWAPNAKAYGDYDERLAWWNHRGDVIQYFESQEQGKDNYFAMTRYNTMMELERRVGQEVVLFGAIGDIRVSSNPRAPVVVKLARSRTESFDVIFFDKDLYASLQLDKQKGEYILVRGVIRKYKNKYNGRESLQIIVNMPSQILVPTDEQIREQRSIQEVLVPLPPMPDMVKSPASHSDKRDDLSEISLDEELKALYKDIPQEDRSNSQWAKDSEWDREDDAETDADSDGDNEDF